MWRYSWVFWLFSFSSASMIILHVPLSSGSVELMTILHVVSSGLLKVTLSLSILKSRARKTLLKIFCVFKFNFYRYFYGSRRVWSLPGSQGGTIVSRFGRWVINVARTDCCVQCMRHEKRFSDLRLVIPGCSFPYCDAIKRKILSFV